MYSKIVITLIVGLFPYVILPLYVVYLLSTRLPEPYKFFFSDYSPAIISVWYALPFIGLGIYWFIRRRSHKEDAKSAASEP